MGQHMGHRCINLLFILAILWFSNLSGSAANANKVSSLLPRSHIIHVAQHKQLNAVCCGPASIEMVFDYWGADIDQKTIADVARTSPNGTYTWDIVRTGHFSNMSLANGSFFPHEAPIAGFQDRPFGYASFSYSSKTSWWKELKALIARDIPVILLMKYAFDDPTGHYRVIVGYDEDGDEGKGVVYFMDPWDRDLGKEMVMWRKCDFESAWNYAAYGSDIPFWGAAIIPWSVNLTTTGKIAHGSSIKVTAVITYPCPEPFDPNDHRAYNASATISLTDGMTLLDGSPKVEVGVLSAGKSFTASWRVKIDNCVPGLSITVTAGGLVNGSVPNIYWKVNGFSPSYNYTDWIGGVANKTLVLNVPNT